MVRESLLEEMHLGVVWRMGGPEIGKAGGKKAAAILNRNSGGQWVMGTQKRPRRTDSQLGVGGRETCPDCVTLGLSLLQMGLHFPPL